MRMLAISMTCLVIACATPVGGPESDDVVAIVSEAEPGPSLRVSGRVVDASTAEPVAGAQILVYQTDHTGTYAPEDPADESTARIRGELTTDAEGRFAFATVQPGEYPDQPPGNRHIHFHEVAAEGYESRTFVLLFDDNVRHEVRTWANETGFGMITELAGTESDGYRTTIEIELLPTDR